ncbi:MAG TPA: hypothetical protein VNH65_10345 [Candidatus Acidoferrum sp.]|nr:hypothetical protein [Candidatus Acidoferrum sp.]
MTPRSFLSPPPLDYNLTMLDRRLPPPFVLRCLCLALTLPFILVSAFGQQSPSHGRILLLPRTMVSGDRATLAVLDINGRLTPGATVVFSNGDRLTTDATGRALFVAPLNPGVILGSIVGREGRVPVTILSPDGSAATAIEVTAIPKFASLTDRFEIAGRGFCGGADANQITISGAPAFVLASSPTSLVVLPPPELEPGRASVDISCAKRYGPPLEVIFVALNLEADSSPLLPGVHRQLSVHVRGTTSKISLEAKNLAPDIAELTGGNPLRVSSSGGEENVAHFEVVGRKRGNFLISIRLLSPRAVPH